MTQKVLQNSEQIDLLFSTLQYLTQLGGDFFQLDQLHKFCLAKIYLKSAVVCFAFV